MLSDEIMYQAVAEFDAHDVINWIIKNRPSEYVAQLRLINEGPIEDKTCSFAPEEFRNDIIQFGRGAKKLNKQIAIWIKNHNFIRNGNKKSANLWGNVVTNSAWKRPPCL